MLKDDFNHLMELFVQSAEGKQVDIQQVFSESLEFFEKLKYRIQNGTPEEKKEAITLMSEMHAKMMSEVRRVCDKTGMTEEQLLSYADNPANFSQDQWRNIQEAKEKMAKTGLDLARAVTGGKTDTIPSQAAGKEKVSAAEADTKKKSASKSKKSGWLRS